MDDTLATFIMGWIFGMMLGLGIGFAVSDGETTKLRKEACEHGYAEWSVKDAGTGKSNFVWKTK